MAGLGDYESQLYAQQFGMGIELLPQQLGSKLAQYADVHDLGGSEVKWVDHIAAIDETSEIKVKSGRNATTKQTGMEYSKRAIDAARYPVSTLTDNMDLVRSLNDPQNRITQVLGAAMGRKRDRIIVNALGGNVRKRTGNGWGGYTTTSTALPSAQQIAVDYVESGSATDSNLTIGKLRRIQTIFGNADVDTSMGLVYVGGHNQKQSLLRSTEVTSADYNAVRALVNGEVNTFLGFEFCWIGNGPNSSDQILPIDSNNVRTNYAFPVGGFAIGEYAAGRRVRVTERDDKQYSTQIFMDEDFGAARLVDEMVVQIKCDEGL